MMPNSMLQPSPISTTLAFSSRVVWFCSVALILSISALVMTVGEARAARGNAPAAPAAAGRGNAAPAAPCGAQDPNPPADALQGAITHDFQTEGYYIISGSGTAFIDGKLLNGRQSTNNPDGGPNGPGCGGGVAVGARKVELKVGDVLIVPPGVIHGWFDIPDHVDYLSFRPSHGVMKNGWVNPTIDAK